MKIDVLKQFVLTLKEVANAAQNTLELFFCSEYSGFMHRDLIKLKQNPEDWKKYKEALQQLRIDNDDFKKTACFTSSSGEEWVIQNQRGPTIKTP